MGRKPKRSRGESPVQSSLSVWLALWGERIAGAEAALAVLGVSSRSSRAPGARRARWPREEPPPPGLVALVDAVCETGRAGVREGRAVGGSEHAVTQVALPIVREGRVAGAIGSSVRGLASSDVKAVVDELSRALRDLELLLGAEAEQGRLAALLFLAGSLLEHEQPRPAAHAFAAALAERAGCERVAVGALRQGRLRLLALSTSVRFAEERGPLQELRAAMQEAVDQDARIELPAPPDAPAHGLRAHEQLLRSAGAAAVCTMPLAFCGRAAGALTCEWGAAQMPDAEARRLVQGAAVLAGPILELFARADAPPLARARAGLARWTERHLGADRSLAGGVLAAAVGLALLLALMPADHRVSARAHVEGRVQRALVASVPGYLAEAHARAGDLVVAGEVLARLDDRDLRLERRRHASEKAQLESEYREALAGQDRIQVSIVRARIAQADAQLALAEEQLARTEVVAPFDGIVLEGDLDRALGSPVEPGDVLFELAPLDGYRIVVEVDERDIADVAEGQRGRLALAALPERPLPMLVERITPVSAAADGRNVFRVEALLEEPVDSLRPGMEGVAKIEVGERRRLWIWTHALVDWLRLRTWSLLP